MAVAQVAIGAYVARALYRSIIGRVQAAQEREKLLTRLWELVHSVEQQHDEVCLPHAKAILPALA